MYQFTTHYVGDDSGVVIDPGADWLLIHTVSLSPQRIACIWHKMDKDPIKWIECGVAIEREVPAIGERD